MMKIWKKIQLLTPAAVLLATLLACAGATSDGAAGAPGDVPAGPLGGQNVLGGNGQATGGDSGLPGGDGGDGQGVPSTQQGEGGLGIGGRCKMGFVVIVKVARGPFLQSCLNATDSGSRYRTTEFNQNGDLVMAPLDNPVAGPKVVFFFKKPHGDEGMIKLGTTCASDGLWKTQKGALGFIFDSGDENCGDYSVRASASWEVEGVNHFSNEFTGPPVPAWDPVLGVQIPLTIDLGPESLYNEDSQS